MASGQPSDVIPYNVEGSHVLDGIRYFGHITAEHLELIKELEVDPDDLYVCGYMKSGNLWLRTIVETILCDDLSSFTINTKDGLMTHLDFNFPFASKHPHPGVFQSHLRYDKLPTEIFRKKSKIIYILRNPKDIAVSFFHFHRGFKYCGPWSGTWDVFFEAFISGDVVYGNCFDHIKSYWIHRKDTNILFVRYEDLKQKTETWIRMIAEFMGKPLSSDKLDRIVEMVEFKNMKENPNLYSDIGTYLTPGYEFMRKGVVGDWRSLFTEEQSRKMDQKLEHLCQETGYHCYDADL